MQRATPETELIAKADAARLEAAIAELPAPFKETLGKIAGVGQVSLERDDFLRIVIALQLIVGA